MDTLTEQYNQAPEIRFPIPAQNLRLKNGRKPRILELTGSCRTCGTHLERPRGIIKEFARCFDFNYTGRCPQCDQLSKFHYRWYPDNQRLVYYTENGLKEYTMGQSPLKAAFYKFLNRLLGR